MQDGQAAAAPDGSRFYALLVEVLKVEANVLLNDVLRPGADADMTAGTSNGQQEGEVAAIGTATDSSAAGGSGMQVDLQPSVADVAGPSGSTVPAAAGKSSVAMDVDEAGPSQPAPGHADGAITAGMGVLPQPFQQPWTPEQQAEQWAAAEHAAAAAAASGSATQQVLYSNSHAPAHALLALTQPTCRDRRRS